MGNVILTREDILRGLKCLDQRAKQDGIAVDVSIYGGAALILAFDLKRATRDVDVSVTGNLNYVRKVAAEIARTQGWPESWLNDGVKGFLSAHEQMRALDDFAPEGETGGIRIYTPSPEYLFAMKCMAMRPEGMDGSHDFSDIEFLAGEAGIRDAESALKLIEAFYPASRIPARVAFGVAEIMGRMAES
ncbi:MAG: nucleotidyltransferase [Azoarcus sp.]|jgi:hypothetical protein|nr:nucleotidyltransferase [Azoarcus sp.]